MHTEIHVYVCVYTHAFTCLGVHIYLYTQTYTYICIYMDNIAMT